MNPSKCPVCDADLKVFEDSNEQGLIEASSDCPNKDYSWSYHAGYTEVEVGSNHLIFWDDSTPAQEQRQLVSQIQTLIDVERTKIKATQLQSSLGVSSPDVGQYHLNPAKQSPMTLWGAVVVAEAVLDHLSGTSQ